MNIVRYLSSVSLWAKTIVRGNAIKLTKCYHYHKQKTYQQEIMNVSLQYQQQETKSKSGLKRDQKDCTQPPGDEIVNTTSPVEDILVIECTPSPGKRREGAEKKYGIGGWIYFLRTCYFCGNIVINYSYHYVYSKIESDSPILNLCWVRFFYILGGCKFI